MNLYWYIGFDMNRCCCTAVYFGVSQVWGGSSSRKKVKMAPIYHRCEGILHPFRLARREFGLTTIGKMDTSCISVPKWQQKPHLVTLPERNSNSPKRKGFIFRPLIISGANYVSFRKGSFHRIIDLCTITYYGGIKLINQEETNIFPTTNMAPEKMACPKGKDHLPTINFQVRTICFRECTLR